ncbi:hypothetical protein EJ06DRAFT_528057 [Trichodelitschia bisporula]|uniref:UBA domain-containing protein n=1 Tax=Trichodelitschia bisporula TaxID=703511 RepID=A0A6G1I466_9PEZI|nr:hypothetical protein EJ06DRAFT_528057 [Trichodelitschia bisporula]
MDDLAGLDWNLKPSNPPPPQPVTSPAFAHPALRPSPAPSTSGRSSPFAPLVPGNNASSSSRPFKPPAKPPAATDSFASLLSTGSNKASNNLSLQERQKLLLEEKAKKEAERRKQLDAQFGAQHSAFWDGLGQGRSAASSGASTPAPVPGARGTPPGLHGGISRPPGVLNNGTAGRHPSDDTDILAAFSAAAPVDASSHFPPPLAGTSGRSTPASLPPKSSTPNAPFPGGRNDPMQFGDDDDPFGLGALPQKPASRQPAQPPADGDDDILGLLAKPVSEIKKAEVKHEPPASAPRRHVEDSDDEVDPRDKAVAAIVNMGFPADKAVDALMQTESGVDVQAAIGILLQAAHEEGKQRSRQRAAPSHAQSPAEETGRQPKRGDSSRPPWMREEEDSAPSASRGRDNKTPVSEKDVSQYAQDIGATLFKSANSLWKTSQKKVQRAVAEFQQEGDGSQPKWMRDAQLQEAAARQAQSQPKGKAQAAPINMTDEAMMLESGGAPPPKPPRKPQPPVAPGLSDSSRSHSPLARSARHLTRQELELQSEQVYISSARRRKAEPPAAAPVAQPVVQKARSPLTSPPLHPNNPFAPKPAPPKAPSPAPPRSAPIPVRPKAPPRQIPPVSPSALATSASHRQKGTEAFKRGDYDAAHTAYSASLTPLPPTHPLAIVVRCNLALTTIKTGDPKAAVVHADTVLQLIGPAKGEGEKIVIGGNEGDKEMKEFYGKALMRKAEALEHLERWTEAGNVWREAVEAGVGGSVSIRGRERCEKTAGKPSSNGATTRPAAVKPTPKAPAKPAVRSAAVQAASAAASAAAVQKLREANAAAEKADDEKFRLMDSIDAKIAGWRGGKADNLRALLGTLDKVLWEQSGWKKVGMQDLVMANKVKIIYMKAIAKVHPDKIAQNATTEQKMISAAVFSTLNEAWDKFKKDNNL